MRIVAILLLALLPALGFDQMQFAGMMAGGGSLVTCGNPPAPTAPYAYAWKDGCTNFTVSNPTGILYSQDPSQNVSSNSTMLMLSVLDCVGLTHVIHEGGLLTNAWLVGATNLSGDTSCQLRSNKISPYDFPQLIRMQITNALANSAATPSIKLNGNGYLTWTGMMAKVDFEAVANHGTIDVDGVWWYPTNLVTVRVDAGDTDWNVRQFMTEYPGPYGTNAMSFALFRVVGDPPDSINLAGATNCHTFEFNDKSSGTIEIPHGPVLTNIDLRTNSGVSYTGTFETQLPNEIGITKVSLDGGGFDPIMFESLASVRIIHMRGSELNQTELDDFFFYLYDSEAEGGTILWSGNAEPTPRDEDNYDEYDDGTWTGADFMNYLKNDRNWSMTP